MAQKTEGLIRHFGGFSLRFLKRRFLLLIVKKTVVNFDIHSNLSTTTTYERRKLVVVHKWSLFIGTLYTNIC